MVKTGDAIWIGTSPTFHIDDNGVEVTLKAKAHEYTFRFPRCIVRQAAGEILLLLDANERKPSNVRPLRRK